MSKVIPAALFYLFFCFSCIAQEKQKNFFDSSIIPALQKRCSDVKSYRMQDGDVVRRYKRDDYVLADTSGLFIYLQKNNVVGLALKTPVNPTLRGYFSLDACSDIYSVDYSVLKKHFKSYPKFLEELHKRHEDEYFEISKTSNKCLINELYSKYVKAK